MCIVRAAAQDFGESTRFDTQEASQNKDGMLTMTMVGSPAS